MVDDLKLRELAEETKASAHLKLDKSLLWLAAALVFAIIGAFASVVTLAGWYIEDHMGPIGETALSVQIAYGGMVAIAIVIIISLLTCGSLFVSGNLQVKAAVAQFKAAEQSEKLLAEAKATRMKEQVQAQKLREESDKADRDLKEKQRASAAASDAREAQARAAATESGSYDVGSGQRVRQGGTVSQDNGPQVKTKDGRNKHGGSRT